MSERRLFLDLDGVLADFDAGYAAISGARSDKTSDNVDWGLVASSPGYYATLPPMSDAFELWSGALDLGFSPTVLTGIPKSVKTAADDKRAWVARHFGEHVPVITCLSRHKSLYGRPGDVLVDDWDKHRDLWVRMGGVWITHVSATASLLALRSLHGVSA